MRLRDENGIWGEWNDTASFELALLNRLTAEASGKRVIALPIEATALGNLKIQMEADS